MDVRFDNARQHAFAGEIHLPGLRPAVFRTFALVPSAAKRSPRIGTACAAGCAGDIVRIEPL
jgi:hypothetical protein